ncbi:SurA N-terminal domain-containing protein [Streptomyces sp. NPDC006879]|uniref:SurA N-terminal domain-containing protein n=1 Tax=Streptomyces sp. NPDC006879 TaxID=3364767 RepID=UPI0036BAB0D8
MHRRTALSVSAALLAAAPLLAACGGEPRPGTAAVVGGERIQTTTLQTQVNDVREAQRRSPQATQLIENSAGLERAKLNTMIQSLVLARAAADTGLSVTAKDLQEARREEISRVGGTEQFETLVLQQASISPAQIDQALRDRLIVAKLTERYGQQKFLEPISAAAKKLGIEVNPRFGAWDGEKLSLTDVKTPWIMQRSEGEQQAPEGT